MTAEELLRENDADGYTRPTRDGLYPHQWNWDSAFAALGWATFDPARAYGELHRLAGMQDADGLVPHLAYSPRPEQYFPSGNWWPPRWGADGRRISAISQPPVAATCLRLLFERHPDEEAARALLEPLERWHAWWLRDGGPVVIHPWESGRDNSPDWDRALAAIPELNVNGLRQDLRWVGLDERPAHRDYARYAWLVLEMRAGEPPSFRVFDPGVASTLAAAAHDLAKLADDLGEDAIGARSREHAQAADERLRAHAAADGLAPAHDLATGATVEQRGCGWALNVLRSDLTGEALDALEDACVHDRDALASDCGVRSWPKCDERFEAHRYWRGPVWASITWLCALGFEPNGRARAATALRARLHAAVDAAGFREFVDGDTGEGLGARDFAWTAALDAWERARVVQRASEE